MSKDTNGFRWFAGRKGSNSLAKRLPYWFALLFLGSQLQGEIVYDNVRNDCYMFHPRRFEYGDDIILSGQARHVRGMQFQYYGDFQPTGNEFVKVRIYKNDGEYTQNEITIPAPKTLLYESEKLHIGFGYNVMTVTNLDVEVPDRFTWTVEWFGLAHTFGNRAGLSHFDAPVAGSSYDDFWVNVPEIGFLPQTFGGSPVANFAMRVFAGPEPEATMEKEINGRQVRLKINGPNFRAGRVESSLDETNWTHLKLVSFRGKPVEIHDLLADTNEVRFYRTQLLADIPWLLEPLRLDTNGSVQLTLNGPGWHEFILAGSYDYVQWFPIVATNLLDMTMDVNVGPASNFGRRFYRIEEAVPTPVIVRSALPISATQYQIHVNGPPGRQCRVEYSTDLVAWHEVATTPFSFTAGIASQGENQSALGEMCLVDDAAGQMRFYRAILLP
jgi:hypothetical protein